MKIKSRIGTKILQIHNKEPFQAYVPKKLPPRPEIDMTNLHNLVEKAHKAISNLNSVTHLVESKDLFIFMNVRKEALVSSQIEGTQSSFSDLILFENQNKPNVEIEDVAEVSNYVQALNFAIKKLDEGFPLSLRLLKKAHLILMQGVRGETKSPGLFRNSQNWIGGSRPENALFVPPPAAKLGECMSDLEKFLHDKSFKMSEFIRCALVHVQFETIHPFLDGNGRLGRLLIVLMLYQSEILNQPILYMSLYLKQNKRLYYDLLQEIREYGTWETWIDFFLEGIIFSAKQAKLEIEQIGSLFKNDIKKIESLGRAKNSCLKVFKLLQKVPQITISQLSTNLNMTAPTAKSALENLIDLKIVVETTGQKRNQIFIYKKYLEILEEGASPLK